MNAHAPTKDASLPAGFESARQLALKVAIVGAGISLVCWLVSGEKFAQSYLVAYMFWLGISASCLAAVLLHHLVGGIWGFIIRRPAESGAMNLPLMAALFIPIALSLSKLYPWANAEYLSHHHHVQLKTAYLNVPFFIGRIAVYLLLWSGFTIFLVRNANAQDKTSDPAPTRRRQFLSGPFLALFFVTFTFAVMDLGMTLEPDWYSTIYGPMVLVGEVLATLSLMVIVTSKLADREPLSQVATAEGYNDLGNLMLAFTMLWAYMSFSQYLISYSGNIAEEVTWYLHRSVGLWRVTAVGLMIFHFFVPFFLLLSRDRKRNAQALAKVGVAILVVRFVDVIWLVVPSKPVDSSFQAIMLLVSLPAAMAAVGGIWVASFIRNLQSRPLLPSSDDPLLTAVLEHHGEGH